MCCGRLFHAEGPACVGKASLSEFDACPWSLIFAGTGGAQTSTGLQICCGIDFISKVGWCSGRCVLSLSGMGNE